MLLKQNLMSKSWNGKQKSYFRNIENNFLLLRRSVSIALDRRLTVQAVALLAKGVLDLDLWITTKVTYKIVIVDSMRKS